MAGAKAEAVVAVAMMAATTFMVSFEQLVHVAARCLLKLLDRQIRATVHIFSIKELDRPPYVTNANARWNRDIELGSLTNKTMDI